MSKILFDVSDPDLRHAFLQHDVISALVPLREDDVPRRGGMSARQMVEHLVWTFELSTGRAAVEPSQLAVGVPGARDFLHNGPTPLGLTNPALISGLPPLRYATLAQARAALGWEVARFLEEAVHTEEIRAHPIFGLLRHEEWHRKHYKHSYHHLRRFGLIEAEQRGVPSELP